MAIIYTYPLNKDIKLADELVGTTEVTVNGSTKTRTRNFLISDLVDFFAGGQIILTTNGNSGPSTFDTITKELNIPDYTNAGVGTLQQVTLNGNETTLYIKASGFKTFGGTELQFLMADGSTTVSSAVNLQAVTDAGNSTTDQIIASSFKKTGGQPNEFLMADGNTTTGSNGRPVILVTVNTPAGSETNTEYMYLMQNPVILTLPTAIGNTNKYNIKSVSTGSPTIYTSLDQTIDDTPNFIQLHVKYSSVTLISNGTNWVII